MTDHRRPARLYRLADAVLQPGFTGTAPPDWLRRRLGDGLGSVILFARNTPDVPSTATLTEALRSENPDVIVAIDEEGGKVTRLEAGTGSSWPGNAALGRVDDPELTATVAAEMGALLAGAGITLNYAPSADVNSNPLNPVIGVRSFGADPTLVARHTAAFVRGLQSTGVAACAKHFPGHGDTRLDSHHDLPVLDLDQATLDMRELPPFRAAIQAGVLAIMAGHLMVPCADPRRPASLSRPILTGLLRERLGFDGLIVTDALEMKAVHRRATLPDLAVQAVAAGADAVCVGSDRTDGEVVIDLREALVAAVTSGRLPEERLAGAATRVATLAAWHRTDAAASAPTRATHCEAGTSAARRALDVHHGSTPGPGLPLRSAPVVVTLDPPGHAALGRTTWGLAGPIAELRSGTLGVAFDQAAATEPALDHAAGRTDRPLVIVVRDAVRLPWVSQALRRLVNQRSDAIVVEMGWPGPDRPGAVHVITYGSSLASARAAAELLCGRG